MIGLYVFLTGVSGLGMVALAAYGAHGSGAAGLADPALFQTAWQIHAVQTLAMLAIGMCRRPNIWLYAAFWLFWGGTVFFAGSLYGRGLGWWLGGSVITPIGGVMLLAGWFALAISGLYRLGYTNRPPKTDE
jgi:uncharacterized membrane protein YgdD (TMEM256/DUF423 family)